VASYSISQLADETGVTPRTIRYYVEIGLLAPPEGAGRGAAYTEEHLNRLQAIKRMQSARLSLEEIREELAQTKPGTEREILAEEAPDLRDSAARYLAKLRERSGLAERRWYDPTAFTAFPGVPPPGTGTAKRGEAYVAEPWSRIPLSADVELHVRRRGNRTDPRIARLIKEAKRILKEEEAE
jgi:DNA-binding transcriptional MerR regulator